MSTQEEAQRRLRTAIEQTIGRKVETPKDFDYLSEYIQEKTGEQVSSSTLKRFWGYVASSSLPRTATLDVLCNVIGYPSWQQFCAACDDSCPPADDTEQPEPVPTVPAASPEPDKRSPFRRLLWPVAAIVVVGVLLLSFRSRSSTQPDRHQFTLHVGDRYATIDDYLRLFGIEKAKDPWGVPLPEHDLVLVWGPQYLHPNWHNTGNTDSLMPTITEWWSAPDSLPEVVARYNRDRHDFLRRMGEVRITFMKNLVDTGYVFLGVYRMSHTLSDSSKIVWERVFDYCDLTNIADLERLRNPSTMFTGR